MAGMATTPALAANVVTAATTAPTLPRINVFKALLDRDEYNRLRVGFREAAKSQDQQGAIKMPNVMVADPSRASAALPRLFFQNKPKSKSCRAKDILALLASQSLLNDAKLPAEPAQAAAKTGPTDNGEAENGKGDSEKPTDTKDKATNLDEPKASGESSNKAADEAKNGTQQPTTTPGNVTSLDRDADKFTAEQDATILKLKAEGKSWAQIGKEIGKAKKQVQARYRDLSKSGGATGNKPTDAAGGPEKNDKTAEDSTDKAEIKQFDKAHDEQQNQASPKAGDGRTIGTLKADDLFSVQDLTILALEKLKYDDECWLRLASRLFDHTGKRVHPDQVKQKLAL